MLHGIKYDNCKTCVSRCAHAGKDREFVCPGGISCKVESTITFGDYIRQLSDDNLSKLLMLYKEYGYAAGNRAEPIGTCGDILRTLKEPYQTQLWCKDGHEGDGMKISSYGEGGIGNEKNGGD